MKPRTYIAAAVVLLLTGCMTTFRPWKLSEVKEGMNKGEIVALLGNPDSIEIKEGEESLYYSYRENYNSPLSGNPSDKYENSRALQEHDFRQSLKTYNYVVTLVGGRVTSYKEVLD